ncbi:hypothetical protein QJS10_CPB11g00874 [Acorus calamus]|uniref:Uncharacterized protein n=1 Tax=Acorus calamus TaxID=4465 RepID=A0AAV9DUS4_ACOCL|nr:hypothetical protein QJS10_CPB11g00874 [Acorus calamus]
MGVWDFGGGLDVGWTLVGQRFVVTGVRSPKRLNRSKSSDQETSDVQDADGSPLPSLREHQQRMPRFLQTLKKGIRCSSARPKPENLKPPCKKPHLSKAAATATLSL